jgi:4-amino-4-deoxy-L-arabinose transferase-like glycosyltransferase
MTPRAIARAVAGLIVLALLICVWALIIDERGSRQISDLDPTYEEMLAVVAAQSAQSNLGGGK